MGEPARVLVVDDSPTILRVVGGLLARQGFEVDLARDGAAGLLKIREAAFDLVLLDFVMPRMNGYQFCRELRALEGTRAQTPVVLMSAKTDRIRGQFVQQTGATDAITKPFDERSLVAVVEGAIARARAKVAVGAARHHVPSDPPPSEVRLTISGEHAIVREALSGDFSIIPIAEILQLLSLQRQTGLLRVSTGRAVAHVGFRDGAVQLARLEGGAEDHRFGRWAIESGVLDRTALAELLEGGLTNDRRIGEALVAKGLMEAPAVREVLARQTAEAIYELVRWTAGKFVHLAGPLPPEAAAAKLDLGVSGLLLEGFRRVDEWRLMESTIVWDQLLTVDEARRRENEARLTAEERRVVEAADGARNVSAVVEASGVPRFEAIRAVYQLLRSHVLRGAA